jgi:hypothetical protein
VVGYVCLGFRHDIGDSAVEPIDAIALVTGSFFVLARFRFFYDPSKPPGDRVLNRDRHKSLINKMGFCGFCNGAKAWAWYVALVEVLGGLALVTNTFRLLGALLLLGLMIPATMCTARIKCVEQNPVDWIDWGCAYLWRVEGLYIVMLGAILWHDASRFI